MARPSKSNPARLRVAGTLRRPARKKSQRGRGASHDALLSRFASDNPNPLFQLATGGRILYANAAAKKLCREWKCRVGGGVPAFLCRFIEESLNGTARQELQAETAGRTFSFVVNPIRTRTGDFLFLYGHDISGLKEAERELVRLRDQAQATALLDPLTGLPNRTLLEDRLARAIENCARAGRKLAVVFMDLDHFKDLNDARGHQEGDRVLVRVARCLAHTIRQTDTLARWGGDELVLLLPGLDDPKEEVGPICQRLQRNLREELARKPAAASLSLSMGVAIYPGDALRPDKLLEQADAALYQAKARGGNAIVFIDSTAGEHE
jgi:diguanylate cyclase (GGDEF)-like protein